MIKTVIPGVDYSYHDRLSLVVDVTRSGIDHSWRQKRAAAGVFRDVVLKADPSHTVIHLIAMGASEKYGSNLNGDIFFKAGQRVHFPEPKDAPHVDVLCGIKDRVWTFEKYAKVYRDHKNTKKDKVHGDVLHAAYNDEQDRAELLISVPHDDPVWRDDVQKMASGEDIPWSMSCKIPFDYCSICGNKAPTSKEYCSHLKENMTALTKSGHRVGMINEGMLFFDISRVRVGADRIAYSLLKAAGLVGGYDDERAEHAFEFPLVLRSDDPFLFFTSDKLADYLKLAEIEKRIEAVGRLPAGVAGLPAREPLSGAQVADLTGPGADLPRVLGALAAEKVSLALPDFFRVVLGENFERLSGSVEKAAQLVPGMYQRLLLDDVATGDAPDVTLSTAIIPLAVKHAVLSLRDAYALDTAHMTNRAVRDAVRGTRSTGIATKAASADSDAVVSKMLRVYAEYERAWCGQQNWDSDLSDRLVASHYVRSR